MSMTYCRYCGVSFGEKYKECRDGIRSHRFIKSQIPTYDNELKEIWISEHPNE